MEIRAYSHCWCCAYVEAIPHLLGDLSEGPLAALELLTEHFLTDHNTTMTIEEHIAGIVHENCTIEIQIENELVNIFPCRIRYECGVARRVFVPEKRMIFRSSACRNDQLEVVECTSFPVRSAVAIGAMAVREC